MAHKCELDTLSLLDLCCSYLTRVSRTDLSSSSQDSTPSPTLRSAFLSSVHRNLELLETPNLDANPTSPAKGQGYGNDDGLVAFRLFAGSAETSRFRVSSPAAATASNAGGLVRTGRPYEYHFAPNPNGDELMRLKEAAVEGQDILARAKMVWPGCQLPWKVITVSGNVIASVGGQSESEELKARKRKKCRPGVKARRARRRQVDEQAAKKNKRNREKKMKKREKARELKKGVVDGTMGTSAK